MNVHPKFEEDRLGAISNVWIEQLLQELAQSLR